MRETLFFVITIVSTFAMCGLMSSCWSYYCWRENHPNHARKQWQRQTDFTKMQKNVLRRGGTVVLYMLPYLYLKYFGSSTVFFNKTAVMIAKGLVFVFFIIGIVEIICLFKDIMVKKKEIQIFLAYCMITAIWICATVSIVMIVRVFTTNTTSLVQIMQIIWYAFSVFTMYPIIYCIKEN